GPELRYHTSRSNSIGTVGRGAWLRSPRSGTSRSISSRWAPGCAPRTPRSPPPPPGPPCPLLEKAPNLGGLSAFGGGEIFVPANRHMAKLGLADSREEGRAYIELLAMCYGSPGAP